jgi:hypothetical protein
MGRRDAPGLVGQFFAQPLGRGPDTARVRINNCFGAVPLTCLVLLSLGACEDSVPSASFRLIAEDVTPDRGCTSLGDKIELYFPTTTDTLRGPAPAFPGYRCSACNPRSQRRSVGP